MGLRVGIVGLSPTTHDLAFDSGLELWGLPWDEGYWPMYSRLFEMHDLRLLESAESKRKSGYLTRLQESHAPVYMQESYFKNANKYPFDDVAKSIGRYYFNSSIAYAMALAIHEKAEEIHVYGVDMKASDEFGYQKPNMEYLIGVAVGKGIKVHIPDESPLCKFSGQGIPFYSHYPTYIKRYGWLG